MRTNVEAPSKIVPNGTLQFCSSNPCRFCETISLVGRSPDASVCKLQKPCYSTLIRRDCRSAPRYGWQLGKALGCHR